MIDLQKIKIGERVFCLTYETIYEPDDDYYGIYLPVGVKSFCVAKKDIYVNGTWVLSRCGDYYHPDNLYYTKDEALTELHKKLKEDWAEYKCNKIIKKLLKVQKIVKRIK